MIKAGWMIAGCFVATLGGGPAAAQTHRGETELAKAIAGRVAGRPVNCISLRTARSSRVIERTAIVYEVGNRLYVNRPRAGAESLGRDDILVTRTTGSQLCRLDGVRLIDRGSRMPSGFVTLGSFTPYARRPAARR